VVRTGLNFIEYEYKISLLTFIHSEKERNGHGSYATHFPLTEETDLAILEGV
jgi:hypothetical protein